MKRLTLIALALLILLTALAEETVFDRTIRVDDAFFFGRIGDEWRLYTREGDVFIDYFWSNDELKENGRLPFAGFGEEQAAPIRFGRGATALMAAVGIDGSILLSSFRGTLQAFQEGIALYRAEGCCWGLFSAEDGMLLDSKTSDCDTLTRVETGVWRGKAGSEERWYYLSGSALCKAEVVDYAAFPALDVENFEAPELPGSLPKVGAEEQLSGLAKVLLQLAGARVHSDGRIEEVTTAACAQAYERLIAGRCDMILVTEPLADYETDVLAAGVTLAQTEIGLDALVFLAPADEADRTYSIEELQSALTDSEALLCHQKTGTGARYAMLALLEGAEPAHPDSTLTEEGAYRNFPGALGYAYRSHIASLPDGVRLIPIEGVEPTEEALAAGAYPLTKTVYAVYRTGQEGWSADALCQYLNGESGQALLQAFGLVPADSKAKETPEEESRFTGDPEEMYEEARYDDLQTLTQLSQEKPVRFAAEIMQVLRQEDVEYIAVDMGVSGQMRIVLLENRTWQTITAQAGSVRVYGVTLGTATWQGISCPLIAAERIETE